MSTVYKWSYAHDSTFREAYWASVAISGEQVVNSLLYSVFAVHLTSRIVVPSDPSTAHGERIDLSAARISDVGTPESVMVTSRQPRSKTPLDLCTVPLTFAHSTTPALSDRR